MSSYIFRGEAGGSKPLLLPEERSWPEGRSESLLQKSIYFIVLRKYPMFGVHLLIYSVTCFFFLASMDCYFSLTNCKGILFSFQHLMQLEIPIKNLVLPLFLKISKDVLSSFKLLSSLTST